MFMLCFSIIYLLLFSLHMYIVYIWRIRDFSSVHLAGHVVAVIIAVNPIGRQQVSDFSY